MRFPRLLSLTNRGFYRARSAPQPNPRSCPEPLIPARDAVERMTGDDLTPEQLTWFKAIVGRHVRFYGRVRTRMERRPFRGDDPPYLAVCGAFDAVHALNVNLHYLGCGPATVGRSKLELAAMDSGAGGVTVPHSGHRSGVVRRS
jgi:hypothetical protein